MLKQVTESIHRHRMQLLRQGSCGLRGSSPVS
jgi:hypothetical protein